MWVDYLGLGLEPARSKTVLAYHVRGPQPTTAKASIPLESYSKFERRHPPSHPSHFSPYSHALNMRPILLSGHERALTQVKYNSDGDIIFSVSKDHVIVSHPRIGWYG